MPRPRRARLFTLALSVSLLAPLAVPALAAPALAAPALAAPAFAAAAFSELPEPSRDQSPVIISEIAAGGARSDADSFFELRNDSAASIDLTGWAIFRCSPQGLRSAEGRPEVDLTGVVLGEGEIFTAAHVGMAIAGGGADAEFTQRYSPEGFGLYLQDPQGRLRDAVGVYPNEPWPTLSECSAFGNVANSLAFALDESWQRVAASGDAGADWVRAAASPGQAKPVRASASDVPEVRISEIAAAGPAGWSDDLVELHNEGVDVVSLGGWALYRCTALGVASADTLQIRFADDAELAPGARLVIGGPGFEHEGVAPDITMQTSLAMTVSGVLLTTAQGLRVDGVTVSNHPDTACQSGEAKLPSVLDYRTGESWQRDETTGQFRVSPRTPGAAPVATGSGTSSTTLSSAPGSSSIAISELATDPLIDPAPADYVQRNFVELGNFGSAPVDVSGWQLVACGADGFRRTETLATVAAGTRIAPGATWVAALSGTAAASTANAVFATGLDFLGAGVWLENAGGERIDSVGVYHANEMDFSNERLSACSNGLTPATFAVDRLSGETFQRVGFTGVDADDFAAEPATPGALATVKRPFAGQLSASARDRVAAGARGAASADAGARRATLTEARLSAAAGHAVSTIGVGRSQPRPARVVESFTGASALGVLTTRAGAGERRAGVGDEIVGLSAHDDGYDFPYVRLRLEAEPTDQTISWSGTTSGRGEVRLSVWNEATQAWRQVQAASPSAPDGVVTLTGDVRADEAAGGVVDVLVHSAPRSAPAGPADDGFADPADYDFAISHITDTQYLSEAYPDVYAEVAGWIIANRAARKIAFATHTGDLIQNWVDSDQNEDRARFEFERASAVQGMLDNAGVPNSVLPGNHDNKRGATNGLFNEYFPPSRYSEKPWFGASITPDDNSANYSTFEAGGADFLMLSLPYAYGEREIAWAEQVVAQHSGHNVVLSTHEHVTPRSPDSPTARSVSSRWVSRAGELFERVIAPNRNVVLVLSGHFHGLGRLVTENAGGIDGHTVVELLADYQEFRTDTGERATGFQRLLQVDLAGGSIAVDTFSSTLGAHHSFPFDYPQVVAENGAADVISNTRPWNVLNAGRQNWYTGDDDDFDVRVNLQYPKSVVTQAVTLAAR